MRKPNQPAILDNIKAKRATGLRIGIATNQEAYRARYLRETLLSGIYDDFFVSCQLGVLKEKPAFFMTVLHRLFEEDESIRPEDIIYFDDKTGPLKAAASVGIQTCLYTDISQVEALLG